ncbi:MAG: selenocysteine lyase [Paenibacillaceae bacterium]|jgi:selenocysteine lyase/cysteine desulfurase|nr:selenocysteine lyase [Paenibacillaceae bacterium]
MPILYPSPADRRQEETGELFAAVRKRIIGEHQAIRTPYGMKRLLYADWCASGRLYAPIEAYMSQVIGPYVGNTHTESNITGASMTHAYRFALQMIKRHVHAGPGDIVIASGTGMTGAVNKLQRLLNLRVPEGMSGRIRLAEEERPVIFITHMEHHSNHISWQETIGEVVIVPPDLEGRVSPLMLERTVAQYRHRPYKIGAFTACSNVTGLAAPVHQLAQVMHRYGGVAFIDYSASAPYVPINMHPLDPEEALDGIMFSPHKFLGGPGTNGILVVNAGLLRNCVPDHPGGGTVVWTDPWGGRYYHANIEEREDGGTPGFLQMIRTALCLKVKEQMGTDRMEERKLKLLGELRRYLDANPRVHVLEGRHWVRQGIVSFTMDGLHYKLVTRLLNDRFGIQARGGCSCAGSYGHYLFGIGSHTSGQIYGQIAAGHTAGKPGWVRISLHPVMELQDVQAIGEALSAIAFHGEEWAGDYCWDDCEGDFRHISGQHTSAIEDLERDWELFQQAL